MKRSIALGGASVAMMLVAGHACAAERAAIATASVIEEFSLNEAAVAVRELPGWTKPRRILVVEGLIPELRQALQRAVPGIEFTGATPADAAQHVSGVDAVIGLCTPEIVAAGTSIRWLQLVFASADRCAAIPAVRQRELLITNMQRISGPVIAEHVMAMTLSFTRGLDLFVPGQSRAEWRAAWRDAPPPGRMTVLKGQTMLVVGLGGIGTEVAERAHALGMRVIATRASGRNGPGFVSYVGLPDELPELAAQADVVVNAAPLTPQTARMFDARFFARMKPTAYFINVGRGPSVDTAALADALNSGRIGGAGLDVTDPAPLPADHPLWRARNVLITPLAAGDSNLGFDAQTRVVIENVRRYVAGERMLSVVDLQRGY